MQSILTTSHATGLEKALINNLSFAGMEKERRRVPNRQYKTDEERKMAKRESQKKFDKTRINLGKSFGDWESHQDICGGGVQDFVKHLLALHRTHCPVFSRASKDRDLILGYKVSGKGDNERLQRLLLAWSDNTQDQKSSSEAKTCCVYIDYAGDSCHSQKGTPGWCTICVKGYLAEDDLVNHMTLFHSYRETTETPSGML